MVRTPRQGKGVGEIGLQEQRQVGLTGRSTSLIDAFGLRTDVPCVLGLFLGSVREIGTSVASICCHAWIIC
ncbi:MAG: hypothetical protein ACK55I_40210, partial [bacterium]